MGDDRTQAARPGLAARRRGVDPRQITRWVTRVAPIVVIAMVLLFYFCFGVLRVPVGMDGVLSIPPDSLCLIDKRSSSVRLGSAVFVDLPAGGTLLSRVTGLQPDGVMTLQNDNPEAVQRDSGEFGPLPASCLRGVVLVVLAGNGEPGEVVRGH